jgi:homoserine kinase type II
MAVFTEISDEEASAFIAPLGVGDLLALRGISSGIENTNYFVDTTQGRWVLTIFERLAFTQLPFYLGLMQHLALGGIPVPKPQANSKGEILFQLKGKPAALVNCLEGQHELQPNIEHCIQVGTMLARMHTCGQTFSLHQPNLRGLAWWEQTVPQVLLYLDTEQTQLITHELAFQQTLAQSPDYAQLPRGPIHADLFRDNVMFSGSASKPQLTGFFDFYFAGVDTWLFDMTVCLNDWCTHLDSGQLDHARAQAFVQAYSSQRPLSQAEMDLMPSVLRSAAFRFWLSRLWDFYLPRQASVLKPHDPAHFERILRQRIEQPWAPVPESRVL